MGNGDTTELQIHIVSDADTKGFQSAASASKDLSAEMGVVNVSAQDVENALGKTEKAAGVNERQMRMLASTLGRDIPGGGELFEAAFAGMQGEEGAMMASTFLLIAGLEILQNAIANLNEGKKESQKLADELADSDAKVSKVTEEQTKAFEEADVAEANFHHNLIRNANDAVDATIKLATARLNAQKANFEKQEDTKHNVADNEIEAMEQRGVISHATAVKMKEQIDEEYHQRKVAMMIAEDQMEAAQAQLNLANKKIEMQTDTGAEGDAATKYKSALGAKTKNDTKISEAQGQIDDAKEVLKELRGKGITEDTVQRFKEDFENATGKSSGDFSLPEMFTQLARARLLGGATDVDQSTLDILKTDSGSGDRDLASYEGAEGTIAGNKKIIAQGQAKKPDIDINADNAKSDLDAARTKLQKDREAVQTLQDQITTTTQTNAVKEGGAVADLGLDQANSELTNARSVADQVTAGGNTTDADQQRLIAAAEKIVGHNVDLQTAANIIESGANNLGVFMSQLNKLAAVLAKTNIPNLQSQINDLKAKMAAVSFNTH
jgi:hypothetical protein